MTEAKFIVATSSSEGAWCTDRGSTLSLINSHIASHKARQGVGRLWRQQAHPTSIAHRSRKIASAHVNSHSHTTSSALQIEGQILRASHDPISPSLKDLNFIFGAQNDDAKESSNDSSLSPSTRVSNDGLDFRGSFRMEPVRVHHVSDQGTPASDRCAPLGYRPNAFFVTRKNSLDEYRMRRDSTSSGHSLLSDRSWQTDISQYSGHSLRQISTTLDPFLQLAVEVSEREKGLLHFYLVEGRHAVFGASRKSDYCPATHVVRRGALTRSPAFVLTHIAVAEYLWCAKQGSDVSAGFFQRRAEAYKEVSRLIQDPGADFDDQICGLITLQHAEFIVVRSDLQTVHLIAMNQFVEKKGGIQCFLTAKDPNRTIIEPKFYTVQYMFAGYQQLANEHLDEISNRFVNDFTRMRNWNLGIWHFRKMSSQHESSDPDHDKKEKHELRQFHNHLCKLVDDHLGNQYEPYFLSSGTFLFLCNMCITLVELNLDAAQARQFLLAVHTSLQLISQTSYKLRLAVAVLLVSYVRCTSQSSNVAIPSFQQALNTNNPHGFDLEVEMCDSAINIMRLFHSLNPQSQVYFGRTLLHTLTGIMGLSDDEPFRDFDLEALKLEFLGIEEIRNKERKVP